MTTSDPQHVDLGIPPPVLPSNTLDEPVWTTIWRDVKQIGIKLYYVIVPHVGSRSNLRDWDLWGPLVFVLALALILSQRAADDQGSLLFCAVFVITAIGSVVITVNSSLLGGHVSFFQSVCVFGYCLFPITLASILCLFWGNFIYRLVVCFVAVAWSSFASIGFFADMVPKDRKVLAMYPI
eukprot:CAMPEP_0184335918 /NCGR_PEP_ID=MMETSP1089-20130417/4414_1 /TAXON_ID=38269 ORGANISM="Gloeochaete wittrockiana, Strain SAG46.84" /NCGR_SAMPLE_ID=MMETSP1089 /ASSEMBLY_ACC=CAM_ASM_000445 /LENGTH=180 /DNA_ID=CAMNT_0026660819 /DNA_START=42 /DNA_END=581 /DNA_ORIENTATION=+